MIRAFLHPRCLAAFLAGRGPWRVAPFGKILAHRLDVDGPIHRAEDFSGSCEAGRSEIVTYVCPTALLDQKIEPQAVGERPRYVPEGAWFAATPQLFSLADAGVATDDGVVYCPRSGTAVQETARQWDRSAAGNALLRAPAFPKAKALRGVTLCLLTLAGTGFYHFLLEALPRLGALRSKFASFDHVLIPDTPGHFASSWLAAARIPTAKPIECGPLAHYRCEQLVFGPPTMTDSRPTRHVVETLRRLFAVGGTAAWAHVDFSRPDVNLDELSARILRFSAASV